MIVRFGLALGAISALATTSAAIEPRKLEGEYWIGSKTILDAPGGEKKDRAYLWLTGKAARDIYEPMPAKPARGPCDEGAWIKQAGALQCWKSDAHGCDVQRGRDARPRAHGARLRLLVQASQTTQLGTSTGPR